MNLRIGLIVGILLVALTAAAMIGFDPEPARTTIDLRGRLSEAEMNALRPGADPEVLRFGFELRASPVESARQCLSFLDYLSRATGLEFELRFIPRNGSVVDDLGRGRIQFAAVGSGTCVTAQAKHGVVPLALAVGASGEPSTRAVIAVPAGSPIRDASELKGKRFAFGNFNSTQGHLIPRIVLAEHGVSLHDLGFVEYLGSHRNCANAVAAGRFDAGGLQDSLAEEMERAGFLRILHRSRPYPSTGIVAGRDVPPPAREKVARALLDFQPQGRDARGLYHWEATDMSGGFVRAAPEAYRELAAWSVRLGFAGPAAR